MTYNNIYIEEEGAIALITIDRPKKLNALNRDTIAELHEAFKELDEDATTKVIIITGSGEKAFVAGADISEFADFNVAQGGELAAKGQELLFSFVANLQTPVIAAVNGFALGGGCELAMACHMRIATANAKFGQPEVNLGIVPGYGGTQRLTQHVGKGKAFELMMTGDMLGAEEAKSLRLVNYVEADKESATQKANEILSKVSTKAPIAIGLVVDCVNAVFNSDENGYQTEANAFARCTGTSDFKEGTDAFLNKRKAEFKGE